MCVHMCPFAFEHVLRPLCGGQRINCRALFFPSTPWVKPSSSGLGTGTSTVFIYIKDSLICARLSWNSLCSFHLSSAGIRVMIHHTCLCSADNHMQDTGLLTHLNCSLDFNGF